MVKTNLILLITALLVTLTLQAPKEDEVHFPVGGYVNHKWYSGTFFCTQVILIFQLAITTMSFSIPREIQTTIRWSSGSTEVLDVHR